MCTNGNRSLCLIAWLWVLYLPVLVAGQPCAIRNFIVVDDFESYDAEEPAARRVQENWVTQPWLGWDPPGVGVYPEFEIVHSGRQAMAIDYNAPWYVCVEREFEHPQDWTVAGADTLVLHVRGLTTNAPAPLCAALEDSTGKSCTVTHQSRQILQTAEWVQWRVFLNSFVGVNLAKIKRIRLGVDCPFSPTPSGAGRVYIDDLWIAKASSLPSPWAAVCLYPADGDVNVPQTPLLKWSPGSPAPDYCDIYFDTDANAVAAATPATAGIYRGRQIQDLTTFAPGTLEWGRTYWWRVDKIGPMNILGERDFVAGPVWCFTTADFLVVDDFERYTDNEDAYETVWQTWYDVWVDGCESWSTCPTMANREREIIHEGRQSMALDYNNVPRPWLTAVERAGLTVNGGNTLVLFVRGLASNYPSAFYLSVKDNNGREETVVHPDPHVTCATEWTEWRIPFHDLEPVNLAQVRKMRIGVGDPYMPTPGGTGRVYVDDIRVVSSAPVAPTPATLLYPPDGAVDISQTPALQWRAGQGARQHDIYLGTDANAVAYATPASADVYCGRDDRWFCVFDVGPLDFPQTWYWRVDEVNDLHPESPCKGPVWHFTTADWLVVEDFESYNFLEGAGTRLYETWIPGYLDGDWWWPMDPWPHLERTLQHGGRQAMVMDYNNAWEPYYGGYYREFLPVGDWTVRGFDTLSLHVRGWALNVPAPLYIEVEDSTAKKAAVVHPDPQVLLATEWREWQIPLGNLSGVNVRKVKKMRLGVGDRKNPQPGGAGIVYVDDIRVIKPAL